MRARTETNTTAGRRAWSEVEALADLEQIIRDVIALWEEQHRAWLDEARYDPTSAIAEFGPTVIDVQTRAAHAFRLQRAWERIALDDGRTLANFRRAYDEAAASLTARLDEEQRIYRSSAWRAAVQRCQRRAVAAATRSDPILLRLQRHEADAARRRGANLGQN